MKTCQKWIFSTVLMGTLTAVNSLAFADCSATTCYGAIQRLYVNTNGNLYIASDGDERNLDCDPVAGVYMTLPATDPNFNRKYAMLLTGYSLNQDVGIRIVTGSSNCTVSYFYIDAP